MTPVEAVCAGAPRAMGLAQGEALRGKVLASRAALERLEAFRARQPWWLPYPLYRRVCEARAMARFVPALARHDLGARERLEGIAEGAGLPLRALALLNASEALIAASRVRLSSPPPGCSAVWVGGAEPCITRNFDYPPLAQPFFAVRESRPEGGFRSIEFTAAPLAGAIDGINEKGLAVTYNYAYTVDQGPAAPTLSMLIAGALARCATVNEAAAWLRAKPRWGAGLLMLADASGDAASLELTASSAALRRGAPGSSVLFHTNAYHCPETRAVEVPRDALFSAAAPPPLRGRRVLESAEVRYARLEGLLEGTPSPEELSRIMADHGADGVPGMRTVCVHEECWATVACLQHFPRQRRMRVSLTAACKAVYADYSL